MFYFIVKILLVNEILVIRNSVENVLILNVENEIYISWFNLFKVCYVLLYWWILLKIVG